MASQEVILGSSGQKLVLRHDSTDRSAYLPGVMLAIRKIKSISGLVIGLEALMD
jgi:4-hydroxy-tetrahydrodipicolinate reductase